MMMTASIIGSLGGKGGGRPTEKRSQRFPNLEGGIHFVLHFHSAVARAVENASGPPMPREGTMPSQLVLCCTVVMLARGAGNWRRV